MPGFGLLGAMLIVGCKAPPPEAPEQLNELAAFLFEHFDDDDPAELEVAVDNLEHWLRFNIEDTEEGYTVDNLEESVIDSVAPDREHNLDKLSGAAVAHESKFKITRFAQTLVLDEQEDVFSSYNTHERTFLTPGECFPGKSCDFVDTENVVEAKYAGLITINTHSQSQYRWVNWEGQYVMLHRSWLIDDPEVKPSTAANVYEQLYVGAVIPWDGGSVRMGTTWIAATMAGGLVSEDSALNIMVNSMQKDGEKLDEYMAGE